MKTKTLLLTLAASALLIAGCSADKNPLKNFRVFTPTVAAVTNDAGAVTATTNYAVSDAVQTGLAGARAVTPYIPAPFGSAVDLALVAATGILGFIARVKSKKAALVPALIRGIEAAGNAEVKAAVQTEAQLSGVQAALHDQVKSLT
jgi:hypothetical protein